MSQTDNNNETPFAIATNSAVISAEDVPVEQPVPDASTNNEMMSGNVSDAGSETPSNNVDAAEGTSEPLTDDATDHGPVNNVGVGNDGSDDGVAAAPEAAAADAVAADADGDADEATDAAADADAEAAVDAAAADAAIDAAAEADNAIVDAADEDFDPDASTENDVRRSAKKQRSTKKRHSNKKRKTRDSEAESSATDSDEWAQWRENGDAGDSLSPEERERRIAARSAKDADDRAGRLQARNATRQQQAAGEPNKKTAVCEAAVDDQQEEQVPEPATPVSHPVKSNRAPKTPVRRVGGVRVSNRRTSNATSSPKTPRVPGQATVTRRRANTTPETTPAKVHTDDHRQSKSLTTKKRKARNQVSNSAKSAKNDRSSGSVVSPADLADYFAAALGTTVQEQERVRLDRKNEQQQAEDAIDVLYHALRSENTIATVSEWLLEKRIALDCYGTFVHADADEATANRKVSLIDTVLTRLDSDGPLDNRPILYSHWIEMVVFLSCTFDDVGLCLVLQHFPQESRFSLRELAGYINICIVEPAVPTDQCRWVDTAKVPLPSLALAIAKVLLEHLLPRKRDWSSAMHKLDNRVRLTEKPNVAKKSSARRAVRRRRR